ncbi:RNA polymerase sigma-70 factor (ECF subfamily) [Anaerobacterium chartisolvens]|uniref:RNA polymerase sigma-70 factor (ECF subfamily) n=1 Tax=Anaerobacterium chartisolvens TaxID=1297424 RepID=A0A369AYY6_9FIRM|nr:sigma-70 family RNA polymerase sigma factor [Anaerobacterium chartisolvens]RCX13548.1 RNA polymerase sigma-70 factor (ECF subfamily) [Anaerobacterium chartisolvens]
MLVLKKVQGGESGLEATDLELVQRCLSGEQEAFAEIVARYKKLIYSVVYNIINDKQEVNDAAQEVFLRIYKSLDRYNPEYKFSTWSAKIATNLCLDILRKKKLDHVPIEEIKEVSSRLDTPEDEYINKEKSSIINQAVSELPDKYRIPIVLFHQNGLSYEEITEILKEPMSIVKNRLYRARLILREKLMPRRKEEVL